MLLVWVSHSASRACRAAACSLHTLYNIYNKQGNTSQKLTAPIYLELSGIVQRFALLAWKRKKQEQLPDNKASFFCSFLKNKFSTPRGAHKRITSLICGASRSPLLPLLGRGKPNETHSPTYPCLIWGRELEQKCWCGELNESYT